MNRSGTVPRRPPLGKGNSRPRLTVPSAPPVRTASWDALRTADPIARVERTPHEGAEARQTMMFEQSIINSTLDLYCADVYVQH